MPWLSLHKGQHNRGSSRRFHRENLRFRGFSIINCRGNCSRLSFSPISGAEGPTPHSRAARVEAWSPPPPLQTWRGPQKSGPVHMEWSAQIRGCIEVERSEWTGVHSGRLGFEVAGSTAFYRAGTKTNTRRNTEKKYTCNPSREHIFTVWQDHLTGSPACWAGPVLDTENNYLELYKQNVLYTTESSPA